jgi:hypothetical protein
MKQEGASLYQLLFAAFVAIALFTLLGAAPAKASALDVASQTQQILPLGGPNSCAPIQVSNFTPYVYDNALNSFDFTVSDASYVAIVGSVGNTSIPLNFFTRVQSTSSGVRYHVDINATPLTGTVPVVVTLLSARAGQPICASIIATSLGSGPVVGTYTPAPAPSGNPAPATPAKPTTTPVSGGGVSTGTATATSANVLKSLCASPASAYRLWLILLVLFAVVVGGLLWLEFPMSWAWAQTPERVATIILVLLVLLLGFWYLSAGCRAALWMPLVAFLIAILGLLAAFWNHPKVTRLLLIEEKTTTIITPPPAAKK